MLCSSVQAWVIRAKPPPAVRVMMLDAALPTHAGLPVRKLSINSTSHSYTVGGSDPVAPGLMSLMNAELKSMDLEGGDHGILH